MISVPSLKRLKNVAISSFVLLVATTAHSLRRNCLAKEEKGQTLLGCREDILFGKSWELQVLKDFVRLFFFFSFLKIGKEVLTFLYNVVGSLF